MTQPGYSTADADAAAVTQLDRHPGSPAPRARPAVHFTADSGWINDPYGITWTGDRYHLFYQAIPGRVTWAPNCHWGHAESGDLIHWQELPLALSPQPYEVGCWSGSFLIDEAGTPTILYTRIVGEDWGHGQVALAHGDPAARAWRTSPADCVLPGPPAELRAHSFRDPYVWRTAEGWTMIMAAGLPDGSGAVLQYRSTDLLQWTYDGVLCSRLSTHDDEVWTGALWECPQLFRLDDDWVLLVSVWDAAVLHYVAAAVGDYDGRVFTPRRWQRLSHGNCAYAMTAFLDRTGRRCVMSWLREEPQNNPALTDFAGAHSVVSMLEKDADGHLRLTRHEDLDLLVGSTVQLAAKQNEAGSDQADSGSVDGAAAAIEIMIPRLSDGHLAVCDSTGLRVRFSRDSVAEAIRLERPGLNEESIPLGTFADTSLRILIDADLVEVFSAGGYGAARIRPTLEPAIRLGWSLPESFVLNTLRSARG